MLLLNWVTQQGSWLSNTVYEVANLQKAEPIVQAAPALQKDQQKQCLREKYLY